MKWIFWLVFVIFLLIIGPVLTIWSLNTLFPRLEIPYTVDTWFAVVILAGVLKARVETK
jgi:hypothetical protein